MRSVVGTALRPGACTSLRRTMRTATRNERGRPSVAHSLALPLGLALILALALAPTASWSRAFPVALAPLAAGVLLWLWWGGRTSRQAEPHGARGSAGERVSSATEPTRHQRLFEASSDAMALWAVEEDGSARYLDVNPAFERLWGVTKAALVGRCAEESATAAVAPALARCLRAGTTVQEELEGPLPSGRRVLRVTVTPLGLRAPGTPSLAAVLRDVTEERRLGTELAQAKAFSETVILKSLVGIGVYRADGTCLVVNDAFVRMVGVSRAQLLAEGLGTSEAWAPGMLELAQAALGTGKVLRREAHSITEDRDVWAERQVVRVTIDQEPHLLVQLVDTTHAHQATEALSGARAALARALELAGVGVWVQDFSDGTLHWDERMFDLFQVPPTRRGALLNQDTWRERCHPEDLPAVLERLKVGLAAGAPFTFDFRALLPDGSTRVLHSAAVVEKDGAGRLLRLVGITDDVSAERAREEARRMAVEAARSRADFLLRAGVELRAPLGTITGLASRMLDGELDAFQRRSVEQMVAAVKASLNMLNDVLDASRLEAGTFHLEAVDFGLEEVLEDVAERDAPQAEERGSELVFEVGAAAPSSLKGDPSRLAQLLHFLVIHALDRTPGGEVRVAVERAIAGTGLLVSVSGAALGSPPREATGWVSEPATEVGAPALAPLEGGLGLELELASRIVHLMGGEVSVDREERGRCLVRVFLPLPEVPRRSGVWRPTELEGVRTLVVDDREASRRAVEVLLEPWPFEVTLARSGPRGLAELEAAAREGRPFQLVLVDSRMPEMDGLEFARRVRSAGGLAGQAAVVMMSTRLGRERVGKVADIDAVVEKPLLRTQLVDVLAHLQLRRRAGLN